MKTIPERTQLDLEDLASKLDRIEAVMGREIVEPFHQLVNGYVVLLQLVDEQGHEIVRLEKQCYGSSTERTSQIFPSPLSQASDTGEQTGGNDSAAGAESPAGVDSSASSMPPEHQQGAPRRRRRGHGRTPARAYTGCVQTMVTHQSLHPGDRCPHCAKGTMYRQHRWSPEVRLKGQVPVIGTLYYLERLRCHLCGALETARLPEEAGSEKYDPTVASIVATLRYGEGLPWNRLQRLQGCAGIPLPASVQWHLVRDGIHRGINAAYDHLLEEGAQGELMHNDDTGMCVLELEKKLKKQQPLLEKDPDRRGVFTTGILSHADNRPPIALFFTGPHHSGENLRDLLGRRDDQLPPPIQMCDALSRNMPKDLKVIVGNCLAHGRRNFVDVVAAFPSEVRYVLEQLKTVYKIDAEAKKQALSEEERLRLHQEQSGPVMEGLERWLKQQFAEKKVEPNSSLGGAISYMLRHWEPLTLFLRVSGAPLDNNVCEQGLKMAIRHRKNSLFYKTTNGAVVGDKYMSLINTCYLSGADPFNYLTQLQRHHERVCATPGDWMPWNYQQQLNTVDQGPTSSGIPPSKAATDIGTTPDG
jgi:transposase